MELGLDRNGKCGYVVCVKAESPQATIRFVMSRQTTECQLEHADLIALVQMTMQRVRELNGNGALILYVEFQSEGRTRRHYPDGRRGVPAPRQAPK